MSTDQRSTSQLQKEIARIRNDLTVSAGTLQKITNHFVNELDKGLSKKGGNIPMIPAWVLDYPTGEETGEYLAIDLGGTNLRVVNVTLKGNNQFETKQSKYSLPEGIRTAEADELFKFMAECLKTFVDDNFPSNLSEPIPLGFTFSYPASQDIIDEGILQRWTKGYDIHGVEGYDVVPMLTKALKELNVPIEVVALINDTTGTLVASTYTDKETRMGLIFGTGVNGAYYERCGDIPKLEGKFVDDISDNTPMAINCEYGSFDNEHAVLPRTKYDIRIDDESPRPGQQSFEKMISGYYMGEVLRMLILDLAEKKLIFGDNGYKQLQEPYVMDSSFPSLFDLDTSDELNDSKKKLQLLGVESTHEDRQALRELASFVGERAARLSVCGIAAICKKRNYKTAHCAADGSVYEKYPGFKERAARALRDIFQWSEKDDPIVIVHAEDGSGVGAAVIAALTQKRVNQGKSVGTKSKMESKVNQ